MAKIFNKHLKRILIKTVFLAVLTTSLLFLSSFGTPQPISQTSPKPTNTEIISGIKQALKVGISAGADRLSAKNGFLNNLAVKILFPPEAQKVEKTLRSVGLGSLCDNVITSVNHAAEDAVTQAKPVFVAAIKQMTVTDASSILLGSQQDAATQYFKRTTTDELKLKFKPIIEGSLNKAGATKYWSTAMTSYNRLPLVSKINPDLVDYATQKAIDGLFHEVAGEELKIRTNFASRSTGLLQKVFGYAEQAKKP